MPGRTGGGANSARWSDGLFVGRDGLVGELITASTAAARGTGSIVLITGEAGIGKTSVARALARRVRDELAVSWGLCVPDRTAPPFWPWRALVTPEPSNPTDAVDDAVGVPRFAQLTLLGDELRQQARAGPRLHIIEDLQWADVASVLLLAHLGSMIDDSPLMVLATVRTGEPRPPQLDLAIEEVRRAATVHELPPLTDRDIAALIGRSGADAELVSLVQARTGGNPLLVGELLRAVPSTIPAERRRELLAQSVPAGVADAVQRRLARLPGPVADVLVTASVMGDAGDLATLAAAHGAGIEPLLDLVDQARAAHFLDATTPGRWQFRHQLIRDAVSASATGAVRARRHADVLEALAGDPSTPPSTIAHHALAALPLFDADRAVALAARAGEAALAQHAYEEAIGWFERALAAAPRDTTSRWRAELLVSSGEAHRHTGGIDAARQAFVRAASLTDDPALLARAALGYADPGADLGIAYRNDDPAAAELLERAIAAQATPESVTTVQLEARLAAQLYFSDEPSRARDLAQSALARARRLGDLRALGAASALVHDAFVVGQSDLDAQLAGSAQLLEWARSTGSVSALLTAHRARVFDLLSAGDLAAVDAEVLAFRRLAEPLRQPGYQWWPALWSAMRALLEGRHDIAEERALAAYRAGADPFPLLSLLNLSFLLFFLRREQGRLVEMEQATRDYAATHSDVPALRASLAFLLAELGRVDEARATLATFDEAALARLHDRNWPASWFQLARAAAICHDDERAATLLDPRRRPAERCVQVSLGTVCLGAADLAAAWLFHTVGDLDAADAHFRSAEELNARLGARSWLAQARADHARMLDERGWPGDREEAAQLAAAARAAAHDIGLATVAPAPGVGTSTTASDPSATFRREGPVWLLEFAGRSARLPDARGLRDIAVLLARPGVAVSVLELAGDAGSMVAGDRGAAALDERARREIRARLAELDADEADAEAAGDGERAALARERRQELAETVARDFGLGGRSRRIGDPVERVRKTVSTRIRRAIATVARVQPELGRHLERSIDTGTWCAYRPAEPIDWQL